LILGAAAPLVVVAYLGSMSLRSHWRASVSHGRAWCCLENGKTACCLKNVKNDDSSSGTLDPELFKGKVRTAYQIARDNPAMLAQLHCYCGCDKEYGHRNLLDCFRDSHSSRCEICLGEALEADRLANQSTPVEQIRDALRARYARD